MLPTLTAPTIADLAFLALPQPIGVFPVPAGYLVIGPGEGHAEIRESCSWDVCRRHFRRRCAITNSPWAGISRRHFTRSMRLIR